jgi:serine/threonine protein kinase
MIREKVLKSISVFEYLPKSALETLAQYFNEKRVSKPEFIIQNGEPNSNIYFITAGKVKVIQTSKIEHVLNEGDFFAEMSIINGNSEVIHAVPVSDTAEVIYIDKKDFAKCIEAQILLRTVLTNIAAIRLSSTGFSGREKSVGNYTILAKLERSDHGVLFSGEHSILKTPVHLKMLPYQFTQDSRYEKRLPHIVRANAHLSSKHIMTPIDIIKAYGTYFVIRNAASGISLSAIFEHQKAIPLRIAVEIILQLADGIAFAHKHNIIHRDLRPENIFINDNGIVMISNFGLTHPDFYNPLYMSPEQIKKMHIETVSDIYSFGIICYKLLANKYPFSGVNAEQILTHKLKADYKSLSDKEAKIPPEFMQLINRSLEPKPEKRLQGLHNIRELLKLWGEENNTENDEKKYHLEEISHEELKNWLQKRFFEKQLKAPEPIKKDEKLYFDFLNLQKIHNNYIEYKLVDPKVLIAKNLESREELYFPSEKNKLLNLFLTMEKERQELYLIHILAKKLLNVTGKYNLITLLKQIIPLAETDNNYILISKKEKKIKHQAEKELKGTCCKLENADEQTILEIAEKLNKPSIIKEKKIYILICPLHTKTRFVGAVALTDIVKTKLETRLVFYTMLSEIMPIAE